MLALLRRTLSRSISSSESSDDDEMTCSRRDCFEGSPRRLELDVPALRRGGVPAELLGGVLLLEWEGVAVLEGGVGDLEEETILFGLERAIEGLRER